MAFTCPSSNTAPVPDAVAQPQDSGSRPPPELDDEADALLEAAAPARAARAAPRRSTRATLDEAAPVATPCARRRRHARRAHARPRRTPCARSSPPRSTKPRPAHPLQLRRRRHARRRGRDRPTPVPLSLPELHANTWVIAATAMVTDTPHPTDARAIRAELRASPVAFTGTGAPRGRSPRAHLALTSRSPRAHLALTSPAAASRPGTSAAPHAASRRARSRRRADRRSAPPASCRASPPCRAGSARASCSAA